MRIATLQQVLPVMALLLALLPLLPPRYTMPLLKSALRSVTALVGSCHRAHAADLPPMAQMGVRG